MTPELHLAARMAGTGLVATAVDALCGICTEDGSDIPIRDTLAAVLHDWTPDQHATGVDQRMVDLVSPGSTAAILAGYRVRIAEATDDPSPLGRLMVAAWREYDEALLARMLEESGA